MNREKQIIQTSFVGILVNLVLAITKFVIGTLANSLDFILDAVNNLSDTLSSFITIIGTKLSLKRPDIKHPLGYGRIEYITSLLVAGLVLYAGIQSLIESVQAIFHPAEPTYTIWGLVIIGITVFGKVGLGIWTEKRGNTLQSNSLIASGKDSKTDALITISTLVSALLFVFFNIHLGGILGALISILIIKSGIEILDESISQLLGERIPQTLADEIKAAIAKISGVKGVYDLILSTYGPHTIVGSVHIEVLDTMSINALDLLEREIAETIYKDFHIYLTGISIYTQNTESPLAKASQAQIQEIISQDKSIKNMHGFYLDPVHKRIQFDVVLDFNERDENKKRAALLKQIKPLFPDYFIQITIDRDIS